MHRVRQSWVRVRLSCTGPGRIVPGDIPAMKKLPPGTEPETTPPCAPGDDPRYLGWFERFNAAEFYDAHDVLEDLWLRTRGADRDFFKGLIQFAGAFVHLRRHRERPGHARDAARLRPAARLFHSARMLLLPYRPRHLRLDVDAICRACETLGGGIERSDFTENPWQPGAQFHYELSA